MSYPEPGTVSPANGVELPVVERNSVEDVREAVEHGRGAQPAWAALSVSERGATLCRVGAQILEREQEICELLSQETGRSLTECRMTEVASTADYISGVIKAGRAALKAQKVRLSPLDFPGKKVVVEAVPRGVIGIIAPWNYPLSNFYKSLWPALLAGNAVLMKPSEHTPRSGAWLAKQCAEILPAGLVTLVQGKGEVGQALIAAVDSVVFTGSVATGRRVAEATAQRLIPCSLELGGKDAAIVLRDCDLTRTVLGIAQWSMHNAGQNCAGIERVYVEEAVADEFVSRLALVVGRLRVAGGDAESSELGPLQNAAQLAIVERHVAGAQEDGAELLAGGKPTGAGYGFEPTVLDRCTEQMEVVREETFGPVVAILRVADAAEAVRRANDSRFGLNGSVWTRDLARGARLARQLEVGVALVNNHSFTGILPQTPWTGVKETGPGVAAGRQAYHNFVRPRTVLVDSSSKPDPFWMPSDENLQKMSLALVERNKGSFTALFRLAGLLGKRIKAIRELGRGQ